MGSNGVGWGQMGSKPGGGGGGGLIVGVAIDWKRLNHEGYKEKEVKTEGKMEYRIQLEIFRRAAIAREGACGSTNLIRQEPRDRASSLVTRQPMKDTKKHEVTVPCPYRA